MNDNKIGVTWYFCPTRLTGTYCYDGGDKIIVNINSRRENAGDLAELVSSATSVDFAWWTLRYSMWLMVRLNGGDWVVAALQLWSQYWSDEQKSKLQIIVTDDKDNSILATADFRFPSDCVSKIAEDLDDIAYNVCDPGPLAEDYDWVREYCKSSRLKPDVLIAQADNHYTLTR